MPKQSDITYETPAQPKQIRLDTTTKCNAFCLSCHRFVSKRQGEMPPQLILEILSDVAGWEKPLEEIVPVNYGEFFCRKDWAWILKIISGKLPQTMIVLPTNGALLKPNMLDDLCAVPTLKIINFSINAFYQETYEKFMKVKYSAIDLIRENMQRIKVLRPDILIVASMVFDPMYQTDLERDSFVYYWKQYSLPQVIAAASARRPEKKSCGANITPCRSIFSDIVVGFDGKLSSCCFDAGFCAFDLGYYSGDVKRDWLSEKFILFRNLHNEHRRQEIELCKECSFA